MTRTSAASLAAACFLGLCVSTPVSAMGPECGKYIAQKQLQLAQWRARSEDEAYRRVARDFEQEKVAIAAEEVTELYCEAMRAQDWSKPLEGSNTPVDSRQKARRRADDAINGAIESPED